MFESKLWADLVLRKNWFCISWRVLPFCPQRAEDGMGQTASHQPFFNHLCGYEFWGTYSDDNSTHPLLIF